MNIYSNAIDAALLHLYDQRSNAYNIPYVERLIPGAPVVVMRLLRRSVGFAVAPRNPKKISSWGALLHDDVSIAARPKGYASRILMDEKLILMEANLEMMEQRICECSSDPACLEAVMCGRADVAIVNEDVAQQQPTLEYIPLQQEWLDLAIKKSSQTVEFIRNCKKVVKNPGFLSHVAGISHGNIGQMGAIVYEC